MPIRHCQLCGIKVIVDEDKASVFPFYCDLCGTKTQMGMSAAAPATPPKAPTVPRMPQAPPPAPAPAQANVSCPQCGTGLSVSPGARPIKTRCHGCTADLAVLPDGNVEEIQGEDLLKFAKTQEVSTDEPQEAGTGTEGLKRKIREIMKRQGGSPATPTTAGPAVAAPTTPRPAAPPPPPPKIMIKPTTSPPPNPPPPPVRPPTAPRIQVSAPEPEPTPLPEPNPPSEVIGAESETELPTDLRLGFIGVGASAGGNKGADEPSPPHPSAPGSTEDAPPEEEAAKEEESEPARPDKATRSQPKGPRPRRVPAVVTLVLLALPVMASAVLPKMNEGTVGEWKEKLGSVFRDGAIVVADWVGNILSPPPPEPEPEPPKPPPKEEPEHAPEEFEEQLVEDYRDYLKRLDRFAAEMDTAKWGDQRREMDAKYQSFKRLEAEYVKTFGRSPNIGGRIRADLEQAITNVTVQAQRTRVNMRKVEGSEVAGPMKVKLDALLAAERALQTDYSGMFGGPYKIPDIGEEAPKPRKEDKQSEVQRAYEDWKAQKDLVEKQGVAVAEMEKFRLQVREKRYLELKAEYERIFGETFQPRD